MGQKLGSFVILLQYVLVLCVSIYVPVLYGLTSGAILLGDIPKDESDAVIRSYFFSRQSQLLIHELTQAEALHMYDVKTIVWNSSLIFLFCVIFLVTVGLFNTNCLLKGLFWGGVLAFFLLFISIFFSFSTFFTVFHQIFFPQGNWQFSSESFLIQTYPEQFWKTMVLQGVFLILIQAILGIVGVYIVRYVVKNLHDPSFRLLLS